jgi:TIR domain
MAQNFLSCDRDQSLLLPPDLRDWLDEDHLAWFVIEAIEALELDALHETGWNVFISYARPDEGIAITLENELRRRGHNAWRDRSEIEPASDCADVVDRAIAIADHFVLLLTEHSTASPQVNRELGLALGATKNVVPILIEECQIPQHIRHIN